MSCQKDHCHGALMSFNGVAKDSINLTDQLKQAKEFFLEYFKETDRYVLNSDGPWMAEPRSSGPIG